MGVAAGEVTEAVPRETATLVVRLALLVVVAAVIAAAAPSPFPVSERLSVCAGLDLYLPKGEPRGAALYLHGGSWLYGDRHSGAWLTGIGEPLREAGFAVATAEYRFGRWPVQLDDAECAANYLRERFGSVVAWGHSAGGHIAAMLALQRHAVDRAVNMSGPLDLTDPRWNENDADTVFPGDRLEASPVHYTGAPLLSVVGDRDHIVPVQGQDIVVAGGDHALTGWDPAPALEFLTRASTP